MKNKLTEIFDKFRPSTPMSEDEMKYMMHVMLSKEKAFDTEVDEIDKTSEIYSHFKPLIEEFQSQVFLKRLKYFTTHKVTLGALIILLQKFETLGDVIMYTFYINMKLKPNSIVNATTICTELFPFGFFSKDQLSEIWILQKTEGIHDNLIDYKEYWEDKNAN